MEAAPGVPAWVPDVEPWRDLSSDLAFTEFLHRVDPVAVLDERPDPKVVRPDGWERLPWGTDDVRRMNQTIAWLQSLDAMSMSRKRRGH